MTVDKRLFPLTAFLGRVSFAAPNPRDCHILNGNQMTLEFSAFGSEEAKLRRVILCTTHRLCCDVLSSRGRCFNSVRCVTCLLCLSCCIWLLGRKLVADWRSYITSQYICHAWSDCKNFILSLSRSILVLTLKCLHHCKVMIKLLFDFTFMLMISDRSDHMVQSAEIIIIFMLPKLLDSTNTIDSQVNNKI